MKPSRILMAGLAVAALVVALRVGAPPASDAVSQEDSRTLRIAEQPHQRAPADRILNNVALRELALHPAASDSLLRGQALQSESEDLFVSDFGDMRIKRFSLEGRFLNGIGEGQGVGPGEIRHLTSFAVHGDTVFVADGASRALSVFLRDGTFVRRAALPLEPFRLVVTPGGLIAQTVSADALFVRLGRDGTPGRRFGRVLAEQEEDANFYAAMNAGLAPLPAGALVPGGGFLYVPDEADLAFAFSSEGSLVRVAETVGRRGFPAPHRGPDGSAIAPRTAAASSGVSLVGPDLYIGVIQRGVRDDVTGEAVSPSRTFLDVYDAGTLAYRHSFALPVPHVLRHAQVVGTRVYGLNADGSRLVAYEMEGP